MAIRYTSEPRNVDLLTGHVLPAQPPKFTVTPAPDTATEHAKALRHLADCLTGRRNTASIEAALSAIAYSLETGDWRFDETGHKRVKAAARAAYEAAAREGVAA